MTSFLWRHKDCVTENMSSKWLTKIFHFQAPPLAKSWLRSWPLLTTKKCLIISQILQCIAYCTIILFTHSFFQSNNAITRKTIALSLSLLVIFGISWIFGFLIFDSNTKADEVFAYIFTITTSLQGNSARNYCIISLSQQMRFAILSLKW